MTFFLMNKKYLQANKNYFWPKDPMHFKPKKIET